MTSKLSENIFSGAAVVVLILIGYLVSALSPGEEKITRSGNAFINGQWFDGEEFRQKTFYVVNGHLTEQKPSKVTDTIDLKDKYIIPALADAHTHHFSDPNLAETINAMYLKEGIFYARNLTNSIKRKRSTLEKGIYNNKTGVDVAYANAGLTSTNGHPIYIYEAIEHGMIANFSEMAKNAAKINASRLAENDAYFIIDTLQDLDEKWATILASKPDIIKIFLINSEEYEKDLSKKYLFGWRGLDPQIVPIIVEYAHAANLKVVAHVETSYDFDVAVESSVDELAHIPGYSSTFNFPADRYSISKKSAISAAEQGILFTPTATIYTDTVGSKTEIRKAYEENFHLLVKSGAKFIIGSDKYFQTPFEEALAIQKMGRFSNAQMLEIWTTGTSQAMFPERKIGELKEEFEANFLVLKKNPLEDINNLRTIETCYKNGKKLTACEQKDPKNLNNKKE